MMSSARCSASDCTPIGAGHHVAIVHVDADLVGLTELPFWSITLQSSTFHVFSTTHLWALAHLEGFEIPI
jgi:hypothetical protein